MTPPVADAESRRTDTLRFDAREPQDDAEVWTRCAMSRESDVLRAALVARPPRALPGGDPRRSLMRRWPGLDSWYRQATALRDVLTASGVEVLGCQAPDTLPNAVFVRDLALPTPAGVIVARPAPQVRAGEERYVSLVLATAGVPIYGRVVPPGTFEGADALWLGPHLVVVGVGIRTNDAGFAQVRHLLGRLGTEAVPVPMAEHGQHLLGRFNPIGPEIALVDHRHAPSLRAVAEDHGIAVVALTDDEDIDERWAVSCLGLGAGRVLMPVGCHRSRRVVEAAGFRVIETPMSEYHRAAGGIGCAVLPLERTASDA